MTPSPHKLPVLSMDASHRPSQLGSEHMEVSGVPTLLKSRGFVLLVVFSGLSRI